MKTRSMRERCVMERLFMAVLTMAVFEASVSSAGVRTGGGTGTRSFGVDYVNNTLQKDGVRTGGGTGTRSFGIDYVNNTLQKDGVRTGRGTGTRSFGVDYINNTLLKAGVRIGRGTGTRSFGVDYVNNTLQKDGRPFRYVAGTVHYFRVPRSYWSNRLATLRAMGANVLQTYVEWNSHEPESNQFNFKEQQDLVEFLKEAQRQKLLVILRTGPFIDAEREMGGLPYWLLRHNPKMKLRTSDPDFLRFVDRWFDHLLPKLKPLIYQNGGPIIMVQVENEYGSYYACDFLYTQHLKHKLRQHLGPDVMLFTTDGASASALRCGKIPQVYATVDFGSTANVTTAFQTQRLFEPQGPLINSEYYSGWLDHWGHPHSGRKTRQVVDTLRRMLQMGANVNIYVAHGGTSFGFTSGANLIDGHYQPCPTSYDYDAPISENGELTPKYLALRNVTQKYTGKAPQPPPERVVQAYGDVNMTISVTMWQVAEQMEQMKSKRPQTFEQLGQNSGFLLYEHRVASLTPDPALLNVSGLRDRGYVYVEDQLQGILSRGENIFQLSVRIRKGQRLRILVENQGRVCVGNFMNDLKGIVSPVYLAGQELVGWNQTNLPMNGSQQATIDQLLDRSQNRLENPAARLPALFRGTFKVVNETSDTFLRLDGWGRGVAFLNGFNLGRYWPLQGPQVTLYVPGRALLQTDNQLVLLELEATPCAGQQQSCHATLTNQPALNGPTPYR